MIRTRCPAELLEAAHRLRVRQALLLVIVWTRLHWRAPWLRLNPGTPRFAPWLAALAVLVPVLALLGFADGGREVLKPAAAWLIEQPWLLHTRPPGRAHIARTHRRNHHSWFAASVVLTLLARLLRQAYGHRRGALIRYPDGRGGGAARLLRARD